MSSQNKVLDYKSKDYINAARSKINGNLNKLALVCFSKLLINFSMMFFVITLPFMIAVSGPIQLGYTTCILRVSRGEYWQVGNLMEGFNNKKRAILLWFVNTLFSLLWSLLLIFPGIIAYYSYSMSFYILRDNPDISTKEAREMSIVMMRGQKWKLAKLQLRFLGMVLFSLLTFGILLLWIIPYIDVSVAEFYENVKNKIR